MLRRRELMGVQSKPQIINLCPAATGTEIVEKWPSLSGSRSMVITGLDPTQDYTIQVTITATWERATSRRLYCYNETSANKFIDTSSEEAPITKTFTVKPTSGGELTISHNAAALNDAEYAASLTNIMLEIGSVAHPFIPYVEP